MAAILVAPLFIAYDSLNSMRAAVSNIQEQDLNATLLLARIRTADEELRQAELRLVYATDSTTVEATTARVTAAVDAVRPRWLAIGNRLDARSCLGSLASGVRGGASW